MPPIGALPIMPLPIIGLPILEEELVLVFMEGIDGMVVAGGMALVAGAVLDDDEGIAVEPVSSTFLLQAPKAKTAQRAKAVMTAGLKFENCICRSFKCDVQAANPVVETRLVCGLTRLNLRELRGKTL